MGGHWHDRAKILLTAAFCCIAGAGFFFFLKNGMTDYMFFRVPFAFLDYEKSGVLVFLENILMLIFWAFIGTQAASVCRKRKPLRACLFAIAAAAIGLVLFLVIPSVNNRNTGNDGWGALQEAVNEEADAVSENTEQGRICRKVRKLQKQPGRGQRL